MAVRDGGLDLWEAVLSRVAGGGAPEDVLSSLRRATVRSCSADEISVVMHGHVPQDGLTAARTLLARSAAELLGRPPAVDVSPGALSGSDVAGDIPLAGAPGTVVPPIPRPQLNENYTFESFVIGPSNRLAHAAAVAVSDAPGQAYNPLFLHSASGMGKSHLLQAACKKLLEQRPETALSYISCEDFQNLFFSAVQAGDVGPFRNRFRCAEVLVVDDIHFLASRERTQEEFFHTFNALYNAARQIILSADCPPREIPKIQERLMSRFKWGLVAEIEPPSFETRLEIIRIKSGMRGFALPPDVMAYIAEQSDASIRELEGTVLKIIGYASLLGTKVDLGLVKEVLQAPSSRRGPAKPIGIEEIMSTVAEYYSVSSSELQARGRTRSVALPRQVSMFLARDLTRHSLESIGSYFGGRDHSTVKHACDKIRDLISSTSDIASAVRTIRQTLSRGDA